MSTIRTRSKTRRGRELTPYVPQQVAPVTPPANLEAQEYDYREPGSGTRTAKQDQNPSAKFWMRPGQGTKDYQMTSSQNPSTQKNWPTGKSIKHSKKNKQ